jgi:hypothetical protein
LAAANAAVAKPGGDGDADWCGAECHPLFDERSASAKGEDVDEIADLNELLRALNPDRDRWVSVAFADDNLNAPQLPESVQAPDPNKPPVPPLPTDRTPGGSSDSRSILLALLFVGFAVLSVLAFVYYRSRRDQSGLHGGGDMGFANPNPPHTSPHPNQTTRSHRAAAAPARRSALDAVDRQLDSRATTSGYRRPATTPQRISRPVPQESNPVCRLFTELDPDGYVDYDGVLYRAWWDGSEEPPAVGDPVRLVDSGTGVLYAVRQF